MLIGRSIVPSDDEPPNGSTVGVIGYGLWQREFGGETTALGKTIALAKHQYTIIGVAPQRVHRHRKQSDRYLDSSHGRGRAAVCAARAWATDRSSSLVDDRRPLQAGRRRGGRSRHRSHRRTGRASRR